MFLDARARPGDSARADVCVVGGGAVGIALAVELANSSRHVVVLERGGQTPQPDDRHIYTVVPGTTLRLGTVDKKPFYLGGNTNHWFGNCQPLDASDFEQRDWVPHSGWPMRRDDLVPYYQRAQHLCGLGEFLFYDADAIRALLAHGPANVSQAVLETRIFQACPVLSFADLHRERLAAAQNVQVMLATHVMRLKANRNGDRVIAVETVRADGRPLHVEADTVILAAGGVENVRLLLCSNDRVPAGLGNAYDLVGRFFMEHPFFPLDLADWKPGKEFRLYVGRPERVGRDELLQTVGNARVWAQFVLSDQMKSAHRLPGIGLWFRPVPFIAPGGSALYRMVNILRERALSPKPASLHQGTVERSRDPEPPFSEEARGTRRVTVCGPGGLHAHSGIRTAARPGESYPAVNPAGSFWPTGSRTLAPHRRSAAAGPRPCTQNRGWRTRIQRSGAGARDETPAQFGGIRLLLSSYWNDAHE